jgi:hypothetical protein
VRGSSSGFAPSERQRALAFFDGEQGAQIWIDFSPFFTA